MRVLVLTAIATCASLWGAQAHAEQYIIDIKRTITSLDEYQECQNASYDGAECQKVLDTWLESHPDDWGKAAELVRRNQNAHVALPYYVTALDKKQVECADEGLAQSVTSALALPKDGNEKILGSASAIVAGPCFDALKEPVLSELDNSYVFENICKVMGEHKALGSLQQKQCDALK